jgi:hypothetical protein
MSAGKQATSYDLCQMQAIALLPFQFLPFNWIQPFTVNSGQKIAALSNDGIAGTLNIVEIE